MRYEISRGMEANGMSSATYFVIFMSSFKNYFMKIVTPFSEGTQGARLDFFQGAWLNIFEMLGCHHKLGNIFQNLYNTFSEFGKRISAYIHLDQRGESNDRTPGL